MTRPRPPLVRVGAKGDDRDRRVSDELLELGDAERRRQLAVRQVEGLEGPPELPAEARRYVEHLIGTIPADTSKIDLTPKPTCRICAC